MSCNETVTKTERLHDQSDLLWTLWFPVSPNIPGILQVRKMFLGHQCWEGKVGEDLDVVGLNYRILSPFQVFQAPPGRTLSAHFRLIAGSDFELNVTDGSKSNKTLLSRITAYYNGKTIKTGSSSVLEISFFSKGSARVTTNVEFVIMGNEGMA